MPRHVETPTSVLGGRVGAMAARTLLVACAVAACGASVIPPTPAQEDAVRQPPPGLRWLRVAKKECVGCLKECWGTRIAKLQAESAKMTAPLSLVTWYLFQNRPFRSWPLESFLGLFTKARVPRPTCRSLLALRLLPGAHWLSSPRPGEPRAVRHARVWRVLLLQAPLRPGVPVPGHQRASAQPCDARPRKGGRERRFVHHAAASAVVARRRRRGVRRSALDDLPDVTSRAPGVGTSRRRKAFPAQI